jgi:hypothetical protein
MELTKTTVRGAGVSQFPSLLGDEVSRRFPETLRRTVGMATVIGFEEFYFRINSTLLTVIIVDASNPQACEVEIASGGGSVGVMDVTLGAEGRSNTKVMELIDDVCQRHSLTRTERPG